MDVLKAEQQSDDPLDYFASIAGQNLSNRLTKNWEDEEACPLQC